MNHFQFLTYGFLKLFLNEVSNHQVEEQNKLLCSYHMKTAVFWVIQQNTLSFWCPQNLLAGFWVCIKLLLKWCMRESVQLFLSHKTTSFKIFWVSTKKFVSSTS